jgi:hypothetical protein
MTPGAGDGVEQMELFYSAGRNIEDRTNTVQNSARFSQFTILLQPFS